MVTVSVVIMSLARTAARVPMDTGMWPLETDVKRATVIQLDLCTGSVMLRLVSVSARKALLEESVKGVHLDITDSLKMDVKVSR